MRCGDDSAGPGIDVEFFEELRKVAEKYPASSRKYSIDTLPSEAERLGVNLDTHIAVTRYEDDRIIIEFEPRDAPVKATQKCCSYNWDGGCRRLCPPVVV